MSKTEKRGGARKGAGRKTKVEEKKLLEIIDAAISPEKFQEIWLTVAEKAAKGSFQHTQLLFNYYYGQPTKRVILEGNKDSPIVIEDARQKLIDQLISRTKSGQDS